MSTPAVTMAIPLCNAEPYIAETMRSLLAQTCGDFELNVHDNGSDDRSRDIVRGFSDPRIRVFESPTRLPVEANWNRCLEAPRGRFLKIVCADDLLAPDCLARQVAVLDAPGNEGVGLVACARSIIDARGRRRMTRGYPPPSGRVMGREAMRRIVRRGTNLLGEPAAVLFRTSLIPRAGRFRALHPYAIDVDYWMRLLALSDLAVLDEPLASFRISPGSWTSRTGLAQYRDFAGFVALAAREHPGIFRATDLAISRLASPLVAAARLLAIRVFARP